MKTVLITGATGAIGKAIAIELAENGCKLILAGRNPDKIAQVKSVIAESTGNENIDIIVADMSEPASIRKATEEVKKKYDSLNALINVAAIFKKQRIENSLGLEYMFATNHLGPFILTNELIDLLKKGSPSKVITISAPSVTKINFDDIGGKEKFSAGFMGAFGASKMMNLMFTYALARRLQGTGVTTNVIHPGLVKSGLTSEMPALMNFIIQMISGKPDRAARMVRRLILEHEYENSNGTFYKFDGKEIKSSEYSHNTELQEKLWKLSEQIA